jgi:hypothetical protein
VRIVTPATVVRWHRRAFAAYWRWNSRPRRVGRPALAGDLRALIRKMPAANPLWGAPRIHGELQKLGIEVSQATVATYLGRRAGSPVPVVDHEWRTHLLSGQGGSPQSGLPNRQAADDRRSPTRRRFASPLRTSRGLIVALGERTCLTFLARSSAVVRHARPPSCAKMASLAVRVGWLVAPARSQCCLLSLDERRAANAERRIIPP